MEALFFLIPVALGLGLLGLGAFLWSLNSRQFDDLDGAGWRAIMDDDLEERDANTPRPLDWGELDELSAPKGGGGAG